MANIIEQELIKKYRTTNSKYGYNITSGGSNFKMSEKTKEKLREKALGRTHSEETKEKMKMYWREHKHPLQGKHHSEESRYKMIEAKLGKTMSKETKDKLSKIKQGENNPFYGKHHTQNIKNIISQKASDRNIGEGNPFYGKHHSIEAKIKMSEAHKKIPKEKHGRYGKTISPKAKEAMRRSNMKPVAQYDKENNFIKIYESATQAGKAVSCGIDAISNCCRGKSKTCMGYIFKYVEDI